MKKQVMIGMMMSLTASFAMAAGALRGADVVRTEVTKAEKREVVRGLEGLTKQVDIVSKSVETLTRIESKVDSTELRAAMANRLTLGEQKIAVIDVAKSIMKIDQATKEINRNELTAEGRAHLELVEKGVKVTAQFLALANRTSAVTGNSKQAQAFAKQVSLIPEMLTKYDTADLQSHIAKMEKAIDARTSAEMNGDEAFAISMGKKQNMSGEEQKKLESKQDELIGCV